MKITITETKTNKKIAEGVYENELISITFSPGNAETLAEGWAYMKSGAKFLANEKAAVSAELSNGWTIKKEAK